MDTNAKEVFRNLFILFLLLSIGAGGSGFLILKDKNEIRAAYLKGTKSKTIAVRELHRSNFTSNSTGGYVDIIGYQDSITYNYYVSTYKESLNIQKNIKVGDTIIVQFIDWGNAVYVIGLKKGNKVFRDPKNYIDTTANKNRLVMVLLFVIAGLLSCGFIYNITKYFSIKRSFWN